MDTAFNQNTNEDNITHLLFVDDEKHIINALTRLFRSPEYVVHSAESGKEGLEILEKNKIDVIISDMRMPEMSGDEFLEQVTERWPNTIRILLTGHADLKSTINAVNLGKIYFYVSKPWDDAQLKALVKQAAERIHLENDRRRLEELTSKQKKALEQINEGLERRISERTEELSEALDALKGTHDQLKKNFVETLKIFSSLLELREKNLNGHANKTAELAQEIALSYGLNEKDAQEILIAGLLHDIGKIGLSDDILKKGYWNLSTMELEQYQTHSILGQEILMGLDQLREVSLLIRSHHEHYDGSGYPDKLRGDMIPLGARILLIANDYFELQRGHIISRPLGSEAACEYIQKHSGSNYDPVLVEVFLKLIQSHNTEKIFHTTSEILNPEQLRPGMILDEDVVTTTGLHLFSKNQALDEEMIFAIQRYQLRTKHTLSIKVTLNRVAMQSNPNVPQKDMYKNKL